MSKALDDITSERKRQIEKEGWSFEHDDGHTDESLAMAAALYAAPIPLFRVDHGHLYMNCSDPWPWHDTDDVSGGRGDCPVWGEVNAWDKREVFDRRCCLVVAGALIAAEIERLDRATENED